MNRRGQHIPLKAAVCLLLCILAVGWICTAAQAEELVASAPVEKTNTLIIAPLRNNAYEGTDANNTVIEELFYALHILRYSGTQISLVPLLDSTQGSAAATPIGYISAQDADLNKEIFTGNIGSISKDGMETSIEQTLNKVIELAKQSDPHAFVILILAKAYSPLWAKLSELLQNTDADVLVIYLDNESRSEDMDAFLQALGVDKDDVDQKFNTLITLKSRVRFMVVTKDRLASSYDALEPVLLEVSGQAQLPLIRSETDSTVTLPEQGVSNVMLVVKNIPDEYDVRITDQKGSIVSPVQQYVDSSGRKILELQDVGGELIITAYDAASVQPPVTDAADTPAPVLADDPQASALPPDSAEITVLPAVSPAPATQAAAEKGVDGTILFDFQCDDTVLLSTQDGQPSYYKNTPVLFSVQPQGDILPGVLQAYPDVSGHLTVTVSDTVHELYPLDTGDGKKEYVGQFTPEKAGIYTVEAELQIGDFYTVRSNSIMIDIMNQPPVPADVPVAEYWIDNPYQPAVPIELDLTTMFSDPDLDSLTYSVSSDADGEFQTDWTDDPFARFSIQENTLTITPLVQAGSRSITIKAMDTDGGAAVSVVQITLHSIYDALAGISIDEPLDFSENIAKNAAVTITAYPQFPIDTSDQGEIASAFIDNASVTCNLEPEGGGNPLSLPMTYQADSGAYQAVYTMPDTAAQYQVYVSFVLSPPEGDTQHKAVSGTTNPVMLGSENTAPKWIANDTDLGSWWMADDGNGELYDLTLDWASLFSDDEDAPRDTEPHLTLSLSILGSGGLAYEFLATADGAYLLTAQGKTAAATAPLVLTGASPITLRFEHYGYYTLHLIAEDPDGQEAEGELTLQLRSLYITVGLAFAALVLLLGLCLLIARLLKPAFGEQTLRVSLRTQADTMTWSIPLEAWRKHNVPLRWIFLYGCVPPMPSLEPIASAVTIKPKRDGIAILTKNDSLQWVSRGEPLPRKFIQTESQPPVILKDTDITLELALQSVSQRFIR
jgi:hypothetical protein